MPSQTTYVLLRGNIHNARRSVSKSIRAPLDAGYELICLRSPTGAPQLEAAAAQQTKQQSKSKTLLVVPKFFYWWCFHKHLYQQTHHSKCMLVLASDFDFAMKVKVVLYVAGRIVNEVVEAVDYDDAKQIALKRNSRYARVVSVTAVF